MSPSEHEHGPLNYNNFPDSYSNYSPQREQKKSPSINRHGFNNSEQMIGTAAFHGYPHHIV
ncbi:hypothetical protein PILCRDRAFT_824169 [Piloderma croceum F 1598]|uniref:Uncharacterized protein n=1 Tax=Piloderma croceum (strain F 1598) TaxID=765440 RepID=A0A0C3AXM1_PILCF|nr:hypothetical protein PILCRDRAFT_824169 [Piloderma croceum F 1598]